MEEHFIMGYSNDFLNQGNLIQGKASVSFEKLEKPVWRSKGKTA